MADVQPQIKAAAEQRHEGFGCPSTGHSFRFHRIQVHSQNVLVELSGGDSKRTASILVLEIVPLIEETQLHLEQTRVSTIVHTIPKVFPHKRTLIVVLE